MLHWPIYILVAWACSIAYFDTRYRRIPNALSLSAIPVALACMLYSGHSLTGARPASAALAAAFAFVLTVPAYAVKKLGAGDVKFLFAIALLTSLQVTVTCFVVAALLGLGVALFWLCMPKLAFVLHALPLHPPRWAADWLITPVQDRRMPYGALLSVGLFVGLWKSIAP